MYQLTQDSNQIIRLSDGAVIPNAPNGDWQLYEAWLAKKGNKPLPAEPIAPPIRTIDARRLRLALFQLNLLDKVEAAISTLDRAAQVNWEYATEIKEDHPLVEALATDLGLDTDAIFDIASKII